MAWSWSHTNEAYEHAFNQLAFFTRAACVEILVEWWMHDHHPDNDHAWTTDRLRTAKKIIQSRHRYSTDGELRSAIWERAADQRTCDNGGFNAWMCPYGCGCHCVDFGPDDHDDQCDGAMFADGTILPLAV